MRLSAEKYLPLAALSLLAACGGGARSVEVGQAPATVGGPSADFPMVIGPPFTVDGVTYTPSDTMNYDAVGYASVSADGDSAVSAAHRSLPLPSYIEVTSLQTGKTILVRTERRGPMSGKALIELSPGAAVQLGVVGQPNAEVRVRRVNPIEQDRALLRTGQSAPARMDTPKSLLTVLQRKLDQQEGVVRIVPAAMPSSEPASPAIANPGLPVAKEKPAKPFAKPKSMPAPKSDPALTAALSVKPAAKPAPKPAPKAPAVALRGKYLVQVGAFASEANARSGASKIGGSVSPAGKLWRLKLGPFATEAEAKAALAKAKVAGYSDARIQRAD